MDYTLSDAYVTHPSTGRRMHQDTSPVTTMVSSDDMNMVIWSLMEVLQSSGVSGAAFDPATPATYQKLLGALNIGYSKCVDSVAALRSMSTSATTSVQVRGYYTPGDGGGGVYRLDATDAASIDNGGTVIVGVGGARWKLVVGERVSVKQFGAKGDGVANDRTAIQAAIDAFPKIFIPEGDYILSGFLTLRSSDITGAGKRKARLRPSGNFPTFVNDQSVNIIYRVASLAIIYSDTVPTSTAVDAQKLAFKIDGASTWPEFSGIHDVEVRGAWWAYEDSTGTYQGRIKDLFAWNCRGGVNKYGGGTTLLFESVFVQGGKYGIHVQNCLSPSFINCATDQLTVPVNEAANLISGCRSVTINGWDAESNVIGGQGVALFSFVQSTVKFSGFTGHLNQMSGAAGEFNSLVLISGGFVEVHGFDPAFDGSSWTYSGAGGPAVIAATSGALVDICTSRLAVPTGGTPSGAWAISANGAGTRVNYRLTSITGSILGAVRADTDSGTFTPAVAGLTVTGSPIYSGTWTRSGDLASVVITINPNGGSTASTAGTTVFTGLPFEPADAATAFSVASNGLAALGAGYLRNISGGAAYAPPWSSSTATIAFALQYRIKT